MAKAEVKESELSLQEQLVLDLTIHGNAFMHFTNDGRIRRLDPKEVMKHGL